MAGKPRLLVLLVAGALGLTACTDQVAGSGTGLKIGPLTVQEATAAALAGFSEAAAVRYQGELTASDGSAFTVDLTATNSGEASGNITVEGLGATIVVLDKTLFLKGAPEFWSAMAARFGVTSGDGTALGNRWVKLPTVLLGVEFADIFAPDVVAQTAGKVTKDADKELTATGDVVPVTVSGGLVRLAAQPPHPVVGIELDEIGSAENTKAENVNVSVTDASTTIGKTYTDLAALAKNELGTAVDALTSISQGNNRFDACGAASCTLAVDVTNPSKKAVRVHLRADWTGDNAPIGTCEQVSEPVAPGTSATMSCAITSPGWVSFFQRANSVPGTHPYGAVWTALALADPPDVTSLEERGAAAPADPKQAKETESGYAVYEISSAGGVWKYGVVAARYWRDHARDQLNGCLGVTGAVCTYSLVTSTDNQGSAYALENQLITDFQSTKGACPAGQWVSCPK